MINMRKKIVISIVIDGQQFFNMWPGFGYWTNDLRQAKIYNGKPKSKLNELDEWVYNTIHASGYNQPGPLIGLMIDSHWSREHINLTEDMLKTVKLYEMLFEIQEL